MGFNSGFKGLMQES